MVQAAYYGSSNQMVIHQGILYGYKEKPKPFATISDDQRKSAAAVASHLEWVINGLNSSIKHVVFVSDSPTSQYRNKYTLYLIGMLFQAKNLNFTWIYTEAGHGKGAPDGVGASIKRMADHYVSHTRKGISNSSELINAVKSSEIMVAEVQASTINNYACKLDEISYISPVPAIMKAHQVIYYDNTFTVKDLACTCGHECSHFNARKWNPIITAPGPPTISDDTTNTDKLHAERSQHLKDRVALMGLFILDNKADGNCFFQAIADVIGNGKSHEFYRSLTAEELRNNPTYDGNSIEGFIEGEFRTVNEYIDYLAEDKTWPDQIAIGALCRRLRIRLKILSGAGTQRDVTIADSSILPSTTLFIGHIPEIHYIAIMKHPGLPIINGSWVVCKVSTSTKSVLKLFIGKVYSLNILNIRCYN